VALLKLDEFAHDGTLPASVAFGDGAAAADVTRNAASSGIAAANSRRMC